MSKWIDKKGFLDGYVNKKSKPDKEIYGGVIYNPTKCPKCDSKNNRIYCTKPPIRYHICKNCHLRFKSVEEL